MEYDVNILLELRRASKPEQFRDQPIEEDYWGKLILKGHNEPQSMKIGEVFELGVYVERLFQTCDRDIAVRHVLQYRRRLNGIFERSHK